MILTWKILSSKKKTSGEGNKLGFERILGLWFTNSSNWAPYLGFLFFIYYSTRLEEIIILKILV
jgi:hypothetical protein